ncbi:MAG: diacylglycerol kinase family protein [Pseudolysinimonas sp.]|uniref:diacylglycerol/lipid kinase family protein n=1 Tax=Pseudolysinimonas sp. TaxID=2680009 RepID=UPI0032659705
MPALPETAPPSRPRTASRTIAVIYNPVKVKREELSAALDAGRGSWGEPMWLETTEDDAGEKVTARAVKAGVDLVIAAGGDGTVRAVAESLRGTGIPLALVPSGTGNLLARNLELTLNDLSDAIDVALNGVDRTIDIGVIDIHRQDGTSDQHAFLVMAGAGVDAKMVENTNEELKKRVGWLAYVDAISRAMRDTSQLNIRRRLDNGPTRSIRAHTLIVGNCGSLPANMVLMPEASIDDGVFDIAFLRPNGFFGWVQIWIKVAWENGILRRTKIGRKLTRDSKPIRALEYTTASSIDVEFTRAEALELDGDGFGTTVGFTARIDPLALTVRMPAPDPAAALD